MIKMPNNVVLLGLGSKARNGKDSTANLIKDFEPNVHILHWADKLYDCTKGRKRISSAKRIMFFKMEYV